MKNTDELNKIFESVLLLNKGLRSEIENKPIKNGDLTDFKSLLILFLEQAEDFTLAVQTLIMNGFSHEANPIVRSFFELFITVKLISNDKTLAQKFIAFAPIRKKKLLEIAKKYESCITNKTEEESIDAPELEADYKRVTDQFNFSSDDYWFKPEPANLREACILTGDQKNYDVVYRLLSDIAHVNILSLNKYFFENAAEEIVINREEDNGYRELGASLTMLLTISNLFDLEFELGFQKNIKELTDRLLDTNQETFEETA